MLAHDDLAAAHLARLDVGEPHNWCDRICERCPVAATCAVRRAELWGWAALLGSGEAEEGDDAIPLPEPEWSDPCPDGPPLESPLAEPLREAGLQLAMALHERFGSPPPQGEPAESNARVAEVTGFVMASKVARLAAHLRADGSAAFAPEVVGDATATMILLEHLDATLVDALAALGPGDGLGATGCERARVALWRLLAPLQATLPAEPRRQIAALTSEGRAPSPFCVRAGVQGR